MPACRTVWYGRLVFIAISATSGSAAGAQTETVVLSQRISTAYEKTADRLESELTAAGERTVRIEPGDTLSDVISNEYKLGVSNAPQAYRVFSTVILRRNEIAVPKDLKAGDTIVVPDLPQIALSRPNPAKALNRVPRIGIDARLSRTFEGAPPQAAPDAPRPAALDVTAEGRPAAQEVVIYRETTVEDAKQALASSDRVEVELAPVEITFEQNDGTSAAGFALAAAEADLIRSKLAGAAKSRPVLIVFDDSWPDDAAFRASRAFFADAIRQVREHYKITDKPLSDSLLAAAGATWLAPPPPGPRHAQRIDLALQPLRQLEPADGRVTVVYLPMFARQQGAEELFEHIITLNQVITNLRGNYSDPAPKDLVRSARDLAEKAVARIRKSSADEVRKTDVALIQAVLAFCEYYGDAARRPCFVNMSWTTPKFYFDPRMPARTYGAFVAAVGNEGPSSTLFSLERQFATRSATPPGDVLAVMNIDSAGKPACSSTPFGSELPPGLFGVGFDGTVGPGVCGTSFAAPRVAWLLAAREAMRTPPDNVLNWRGKLWFEISGSQDPSAADYNRVRLNVAKLFSSIP